MEGIKAKGENGRKLESESRKPGRRKIMKNWILGLSVLLNVLLVGVLVFLNDRYGLWAKVPRVALEEGRVLGMAPQHEWNRNYQVRREMFRLDKNESARVLMLGDSLTAQGEWNAMLGEPLVANRGIDGDTSVGVLARIGDDADFGGDAVVIWIGTNDVLQGQAAGPIAQRIIEAARGKAEHPRDSAEPKGKTNVWPREGNRSEAEQILKAGRPAADSGGLIADGEAASQPRADSGGLIADRSKLVPSSATVDALDAGRSTLDLVPEAPKIFVLGIPPMARWWEGAPEKNSKIQEINIMLAKEAEGNGYRFIKLESVLADENGFLRGEMTSDGVHLSAKGYVEVIQRLKEVGLWPRTED